MELSEVIKNRRLIDINLFNGKLTYAGMCLVATKRLIVLANYDFRKKTYDGFSIFKNESFDSYEIWKKKYVQLEVDNSTDIINKYKVDKYKTFYSWFKKLCSTKLITFFVDNDFKKYYVGKILKVDTKKITVKLIDKKGNWITTKSFKISDIDFFSFDTNYENNLRRSAVGV